MKSWIIAIIAATYFAACDTADSNEVIKNIKEGQKIGIGHVDDIGRILGLRHDEMAGRTFKSVTQDLETRIPRSIKKRQNLITVDERSGEILLVEKLDREKLCRKAKECFIKLKVITIRGNLDDWLNLRFNIVDINDNRPQFQKDRFNVIFGEDDYSIGDIIPLNDLRASDADIGENGKIMYSLQKNPYFEIAAGNGDGSPTLGLRVLKTLDHEMQSTFNVTLHAKDGGVPALESTTVLNVRITDANDNVPVFGQKEYTVEAPENKMPSTGLVRVHATDKDSGRYGEVRYYIEPNFLKLWGGLVSVHPISGEVTLEKSLDKAEHDKLKIPIEAHDGDSKRHGTAWIILTVLDVNDHSPDIQITFIKYNQNNTGYILESSPANEVVAHVSATDEDEGMNAEVTFDVRTFAKRRATTGFEDVVDVFNFQDNGRLSTGRSLDREQYQEYLINITACDRGVPMRCSDAGIKLIVLDVNDNRPIFVGRRDIVTVREDKEVGAVIGHVEAEDRDAANPPIYCLKNDKIVNSQNGIVTYAISEADQKYFAIDHTSGRIRLRKKLDHESQKLFEVVVTATDGGTPSQSTRITVPIKVHDVNDNKPTFINPARNGTSVDATILKDQPIMVVKARDQDNGKNSKIRYSIVRHNGVPKAEPKRRQGLFMINPTSGTLRLNFSKVNLTSFMGSHTIVIKARDSADFPLSSFLLLHIKVTDADIPYPITAGAFNSKFSIIVIVLSAASLMLVILIVVILIRRRRRNRPHTYDCKMGKEIERSWISLPKCSDQRGDDESHSNPTEMRGKDTPECGSSSPASDIRREVKMNTSTSLSLPIIRSVDMDSGRGESGSENDEFTQSDMGAYSQSHSRPASKSSNRASNLSDVTSSRVSELGPRCTESCRTFGHSDTCWLPSPNSDSYRPPSISSHQSLRYSSPSSVPPRYYDCTNREEGLVTEQPVRVTGEPYLGTSSEYFQTLPFNRNRQAEVPNSSYDMELETIAEGIPLGLQQPFEGADNRDVDDVCDLTNSRLSTSTDPRPVASNAGAATIRRMGKHVVEMNRGNNWNTTKYHSMSYLPGPAYAFSYNDISHDSPLLNMYSPARITPHHAVYPYVTFSPLAQDDSCSQDVRCVDSDRPVLFRRPPEGGYHRSYADHSGTPDDTKTALLTTGSCIPDCSFPGATRDLYL